MRYKFLFLVCCLTSVVSYGQDTPLLYKLSGGLRLGFTSGFAAKYFVNDKIALEGIAGIHYYRGSGVTALVEVHYPNVFDVENLFLYLGGGAHTGYYFWYGVPGHWPNKAPDFPFYAGLDLIGGLEYRLKEYPFTLSFDLKPQVNFLGYYYDIAGSGITLRYILK